MEKVKKIIGSGFLEKVIRLNFDVFLVYLLLNMYILLKIRADFAVYDYMVSYITSAMLITANLFLLSSIYLLNKVSDIKEDLKNQTDIKNEYAETIIKYYWAANLFSFVIYFYIGKGFLIYWLAFFVLGLFYSYPRSFRLKNLPLLKNLIPSFCWYLSICLLIIVNTKSPDILAVLIENISIWFSLILFEILWDLPDREGDRLSGVKTIPVLIGFKNTKTLLIIMNVLLLVFLASYKAKSIVFVILLFLLSINKDTPKRYYHLIIFAASLIYLLYGILLFLKI